MTNRLEKKLVTIASKLIELLQKQISVILYEPSVTRKLTWKTTDIFLCTLKLSTSGRYSKKIKNYLI